MEGKPVKAGVEKDLQSARREIASTIRSEIGPSGAKKAKKGKFQPKDSNKVRPVVHSKLIKRKKAAASLLD